MEEEQAKNSDTVTSIPTPVPEPTLVAPEPVSVPADPIPESPAPETVQTETPVIEVMPASTQVSESVPVSVDEKLPEPTSSAPAPQPPQAPQLQSLAQQDQRGFIRSLLVKAQAKIQFNKQKKLDKIIQLAQKKQIITNDDVQKLLRVSDATATRYLVKLVQQGHLARTGNPRDAKYQFLR